MTEVPTPVPKVPTPVPKVPRGRLASLYMDKMKIPPMGHHQRPVSPGGVIESFKKKKKKKMSVLYRQRQIFPKGFPKRTNRDFHAENMQL